MNRKRGHWMTWALMMVVMAALSSPANATLMVNVGGTIAGGTVVGGNTFTDNTAVDANPTLGIIDIGAFLNTIAVNFIINGFSATSGSPIAQMSGNGNGNLEPAVILPLGVDIFVTDTDFTSPPTHLILNQTINLLSSVGGLTATATAVGYYGAGNAPFEVNGPSTANATAFVAGGSGGNVPSFSGVINGPTPYSLTSAIHIDILARGTDPIQNLQVNGNLAATYIPEPSSAMLLGIGIVGLSLFWRKLGPKSL